LRLNKGDTPMTTFYIVVGIAVITAIITIIAFDRDQHNVDPKDPEDENKKR